MPARTEAPLADAPHERLRSIRPDPAAQTPPPDVEAEAAYEILGKERPRLGLVRTQRIVERLRLLEILEQRQRTRIAHQSQAGRSQRRQG